MITTETFISLTGTVVLAAAMLFTVAWIPWSIAAVLYRSSLGSMFIRNSMAYLSSTLSILTLVGALYHPSYLQLVPPLSHFIAFILSDPSLTSLSAPALDTLCGIVIAECIVALLLPLLLTVSLLIGCMCNFVITPPLGLLWRFIDFLDLHIPARSIPHAMRIQESVKKVKQAFNAEQKGVSSMNLEGDEEHFVDIALRRKMIRSIYRIFGISEND